MDLNVSVPMFFLFVNNLASRGICMSQLEDGGAKMEPA